MTEKHEQIMVGSIDFMNSKIQALLAGFITVKSAKMAVEKQFSSIKTTY